MNTTTVAKIVPSNHVYTHVLTAVIFLTIQLFSVQPAGARGVTPEDWGLKEFHIENDVLGDIYFYVTLEGIDREKPLLFVVQGSGGLPSLIYVKYAENSKKLGTLPTDMIQGFSDRFHVAYMAKPGTSFCDTVEVDTFNPMEILEGYQPSEEYIQRCDLERQVRASSIVIDYLSAALPIHNETIIALGTSEGGRVVPKLAAENKKITHVVCMLSGGLNHFYDSIINERIKAENGEISHRQAQENIDNLFVEIEKIYGEPESTDKVWYGHPYKRWASFCSDIPLDHLVKIDIPIFILGGSKDRNQPILQADYIKLEFLRLGKKNLTYHVIPGCNHWLYETVVEEGKEKGVSHRDEAFKMVVNWIDSNDPKYGYSEIQ